MKLYIGKISEERYIATLNPKEGFKEIDVKDEFVESWDNFDANDIGWQTILREIDRKS